MPTLYLLKILQWSFEVGRNDIETWFSPPFSLPRIFLLSLLQALVLSHYSFLSKSGKKKILSSLIHDHSRTSENKVLKSSWYDSHSNKVFQEWKGCPIAGIKQSAKSVKICRGEVTLAAELSTDCNGSTRRSIDRSPAKRCLFLLLSFFVVANQSRSIIKLRPEEPAG